MLRDVEAEPKYITTIPQRRSVCWIPCTFITNRCHSDDVTSQVMNHLDFILAENEE
jgi:hypothetical protein